MQVLALSLEDDKSHHRLQVVLLLALSFLQFFYLLRYQQTFVLFVETEPHTIYLFDYVIQKSHEDDSSSLSSLPAFSLPLNADNSYPNVEYIGGIHLLYYIVVAYRLYEKLCLEYHHLPPLRHVLVLSTHALTYPLN